MTLSLFLKHMVPGKIVEWGLPPGGKGRLVLLFFLKKLEAPIAWVQTVSELQVYPPAWASQGLDLENIFFLQSQEPFKELRPLFLENTFKTIIIDSPSRVSRGDLSFLAQSLRQQGQVLFLIRSYYLSSRWGNPFSSLRINVSIARPGIYGFHFLKGHSSSYVEIKESEFWCG